MINSTSKHGVYALYKGDRLYYVGLATNLRRRIKQHLNDRHAGKWNRFSLYLVRKANHIKELESLILRIANPKGNAAIGRLKGAEDLKTALEQNIKAEQNSQLQKLLGRKRKVKNTPKTALRINPGNKTPSLAKYVNKSFEIRMAHKNTTIKAKVKPNGIIVWNNILFSSTSIDKTK